MQATIEFQGQLVKVKPHRPDNKKNVPPESRRGIVTEFSKKSRGRMLEKVARLSKVDCVHFVTLTFDDSNIPHDSVETQGHMRALWEHFRRDYPMSSAIWRIEIKPRRTGRYVGHGVPHIHIMLWGVDYDLPSDDSPNYSGGICDLWTRIVNRARPEMQEAIKDGWRIRTDHKLVTGSRGIMYYISKYAAKVEHDDMPKDAILVYMPYSHEGRFWGVFNSRYLPFADLEIVTLDAAVWVHREFKSICSGEYWELNFYSDWQGYKLFTDDARDYIRLLDELIDDYRYVTYYRDIE